jgi:uncharacterized protein (DUF885 family)
MQRTLTIALAVVCSALAVDVAAQGHAFQRLAGEYFHFTLEENPLQATMSGDHRYNDRLPDVSPSAMVEHNRRIQEFLDRLEALNRDGLSPQDRISYDMLHRILRERLAEFEFGTYLMPITNRSGFHVSFPQLPDRVPLNTTLDYDNYITRLGAFRRYVDDNIALMREGIKAGRVLPAVVLDGWEASVSAHIVEDPRQSLLYAPFLEPDPDIPADEWEVLADNALGAIAQSVVPGYREFYQFVEQEYVPSARATIGASELPEGRAFYEHRVRRFTTLEVTPKEVHQLGLDEVARIRAEMQEVIDGVGFEGTFAEFVEFLRTDERFYVDSPEQLMKEVAFVLKRIDGELPRLFKTLPRMPYGIKRVPDYIAPRTTTAYYNPPAGDGTRAGYYFVNCYDLPSRPLYEVEALSLHEAVPGHHLQIAIMQELEGVPEFRRFAWVTAFGEGWALYAERLGLEVGFYTDPYSNFGRLTYEMWRACRLVVDTGMHYFGWTRQQAIDFMAENSALTLHNITTEVDRYIAWPGQALAYKIGELKIRELRQNAEERLGPAFDVREFHDVVLGSGAVPLDVLEDNVLAWVDAAASR